jgi:hypothetical protein
MAGHSIPTSVSKIGWKNNFFLENPHIVLNKKQSYILVWLYCNIVVVFFKCTHVSRELAIWNKTKYCSVTIGHKACHSKLLSTYYITVYFQNIFVSSLKG